MANGLPKEVLEMLMPGSTNRPKIPSGMFETTTDEEALADTMTILQRIADMAHRADDETIALAHINNLARDTIDALKKRRLS